MCERSANRKRKREILRKNSSILRIMRIFKNCANFPNSESPDDFEKFENFKNVVRNGGNL